jgi:DNA primase
MSSISDPLDVLQSLDVDVVRTGKREITCRCPVHYKVVGHEDSNPSFSMNRMTGAWICYSCGARGSLLSLVEQVTGSVDMDALREWALDVGIKRLTTEEEHDEEDPLYVDEWEYLRFGEVPYQRLRRRNIDPRVAWRYGIRWNSETRAIVTPVIDTSGRLLGWQEKGADWFKNRPTGMEKHSTLFGWHYVDDDEPVILVESPLDVVRLASIGIENGVASFGAMISDEQRRLLGQCAGVIIALDNDKAGIGQAKMLRKALPLLRQGVLFWAYGDCDAKDPGDQSLREVVRSWRDASILPWWT